MMMRAEFSILGLVEIAGGVAIAAAVREIAAVRSWLPAASCTRHVLENAAGSLGAMACEG